MDANQIHFGWVRDEAEVDRLLPTLPRPMFGDALPMDDKKEVYLYDIVRKVIGKDAPKGPQGIGDCVSWGWGNLSNYVGCVQIFNNLKAKNLLFLPEREDCTEADYLRLTNDRNIIVEEYQECATESIYALSRVEIGGQRGSMSDGSTGIWASKAVSTKGELSRKYLESKGLSGAYDKNRAKQWGANGLPDELEPDAYNHRVKTVSMVTSFEQAAATIQNGYPVAVCSDQGFTMTRDTQGFCKPSGTWYHCMLFMACRFDRPGLCCSQSWGANTPDGPVVLNQPDNSFWVDAKVCDRMLGQRDSFTGSQFDGYPSQDLITWKH